MRTPKIPRPEGPYLSPRELARMLGVSVDVVYIWIEEGRVASLKIHYGRRIYHWIPEEEVERLKKEKPPKDILLSTREAAEMLGVSQIVVGDLIRSGKLRAIKVGLHYKIPETEILKLKSQ
ncbi:DNA-binding protein [Thermococcus sp. M39]|uniref:helix-turn-helix domain-containing protein n=1 Tax=Thermococcus sp. M39 TaxID=1638262 RepID=UPI00143B2B28|nr:helix-turn-helix domain-containing protein [Thermococcus sp. M39]NJE08566.1 DNA-binding protein [Thermococcus sp. M39]